MIREEFQVLDHSVVIETDSDSVAALLAYLSQTSVQDIPVTSVIRYSVCRTTDGFAVAEDGRLLDVEFSAASVLEQIHRRMHRRVFEAAAGRGWVRLHAGLASWLDTRFLVVGSKGSGKTTLLSRLALGGAEVEGDEIVMIAGDLVAAFPRRLHVKEGTTDLVPGLAAALDDVPSVDSGTGGLVYAWDPGVSGFPWRTRFAAIDWVLLLEPNHGGQSRVIPRARHEIAPLVMREVLVDDPSDRSWLGPVCAVLAGAQSYELRLGRLDQAVEQLMAILETDGEPT